MNDKHMTRAQVVREIAARAGVDNRTALSVLQGKVTNREANERARAALQELGISAPQSTAITSRGDARA